MLEYIKNTTIAAGERVEVYFSEVKNVLSIKKLDNQSDYFNRIVAQAQYLHLQDCEFVYRGKRTIIRGTYVGTIEVIPMIEKMVHEVDGQFFDVNGSQVNAAKYCVCYKSMIIAEGVFMKSLNSKSM